MKKTPPHILIIGTLILFIGFASLVAFLRQRPTIQAEDESLPTESPLVQESTLPVAMPSADPTALSLTDIIITNSPGPDVSPLQHQTTFTAQDQIYITVKLPADRLGAELSAELTYTVDQSQLGPVTTVVKPGESTHTAMFELLPPPAGWPEGEYVLSIVDRSSNALRQLPISVR